MAERKMSEYLASGEVSKIKIADNIQYIKADNPDYDGMFMRIGAGGATELYKAVDQDVIIEDTIDVDTPIPLAWTEMFSITTTHEITPENGTFTFSGDFFNDSSQDTELWIRIKENGVQVGSDFIYNLWKDTGEDHQQVAMSTISTKTIPVGAVVTLELGSSKEGAITMNGSYQIAKFRAIAAQAAPVGTALTTHEVEAFDWNQLPDSDPHVAGKLYRNRRDLLKISQG